MKTIHCLLLLSCCHYLSAQTDAEAKSLAIIRENIAAFSTNLVAGNYDAVVAAYTEDAKIFPNNQEILRGSEAIRNYWTPAPDKKTRTSYHRITSEEIKILGNEAYDWGYYEGKTLSLDGKETPWKGKYVIVWKEITPGVWKIYLDIWNRVPGG
ncbi:MAG: DUF4440 domain-containing protein [Lewinellaceae bacterium]|nr:DUF4440 domain-containing protein [Lewinellaceae bacterium]